MALLASENWTGLRIRAISAVVMLCILLAAELLGGMVFSMLVVSAALLMIREWDVLTEQENILWKTAGIFYVAIPCGCLIWLRNLPEGLELTLAILLIVCATDIGAYFSGRAIGGPKLAPAISPNKTWAGLFGGMSAAAIIAVITTSFSPYPASAFGAFWLGMLFAIVAQAGDLFESWLKRRVGAKDSGTLIPGHGGLLDRVDGLITAIPVFSILVFLA